MTSRAQTMKVLRPIVAARANGVCEIGDRCPFPPSELHHVLPRSRASRGNVHVLDEWATEQVAAGVTPEMPWLLMLCQRCHAIAHSNQLWARSIGVLVDGTASAKDGRVVYRGTFAPLLDLFGEVAA